MTETDLETEFVSEPDMRAEPDSLAAPRPFCPMCEMRMITVNQPHPSANYECLRCGHTESKQG